MCIAPLRRGREGRLSRSTYDRPECRLNPQPVGVTSRRKNALVPGHWAGLHHGSARGLAPASRAGRVDSGAAWQKCVPLPRRTGRAPRFPSGQNGGGTLILPYTSGRDVTPRSGHGGRARLPGQIPRYPTQAGEYRSRLHLSAPPTAPICTIPLCGFVAEPGLLRSSPASCQRAIFLADQPLDQFSIVDVPPPP
jgi:hypothetical protein